MNKLSVFVAGVFLLMTYASSYAGESAEDTVIAQKIRVMALEPVLFRHGICADTADCDRRSVMRFTVAGNVAWRIYGVKHRYVIYELLSKQLDFVSKLPRNKSYSLYIYREEERDVGFFEKPIAQQTIQGEK
ncbi:MAG: hypothetical protein Q8J80_00385 [Gallionella sp.]|nr:hypothetical protein [Gallionella sp.]